MKNLQERIKEKQQFLISSLKHIDFNRSAPTVKTTTNKTEAEPRLASFEEFYKLFPDSDLKHK